MQLEIVWTIPMVHETLETSKARQSKLLDSHSVSDNSERSEAIIINHHRLSIDTINYTLIPLF